MISNHLKNVFNDFFGELLRLFPATFSIVKNKNDSDAIQKTWLTALNDQKLIDICDGLNEYLLERCLIRFQLLTQEFIPSCGQFIETYKKELMKHLDDVRVDPDPIEWDC